LNKTVSEAVENKEPKSSPPVRAVIVLTDNLSSWTQVSPLVSTTMDETHESMWENHQSCCFYWKLGNIISRQQWSEYHIDYKCEGGHFSVSGSCVTGSNPDLVSSGETRVNPGIRSWNKKHLSDWVRCQKAIGGVYFTNMWRAETLQPGLEFNNFKPRLEGGIFKCISWLNGSLFWEVMIGVFWKGLSRPIYWHQSLFYLNSPTIFLSLRL
jgi:hypothetical protein